MKLYEVTGTFRMYVLAMDDVRAQSVAKLSMRPSCTELDETEWESRLLTEKDRPRLSRKILGSLPWKDKTSEVRPNNDGRKSFFTEWDEETIGDLLR